MKGRLAGGEALMARRDGRGSAREGLSRRRDRRCPPGTRLLPIVRRHHPDLQFVQVFEKFSGTQRELLRASAGRRNRNGLNCTRHLIMHKGAGSVVAMAGTKTNITIQVRTKCPLATLVEDSN